jgi:hypothetical protein
VEVPQGRSWRVGYHRLQGESLVFNLYREGVIDPTRTLTGLSALFQGGEDVSSISHIKVEQRNEN